MSQPSQYFRNPAAEITYCPAGYIRTDWQAMVATDAELRAIYEHVLRAMRRYQLTALLFVHAQPQSIPPTVQRWLIENWIPRAVAEAGYRRCAIAETTATTSREAARAIGEQLGVPLEFAFFDEVSAAEQWLQRPADEK